jgi:ribosomal protein S18 acetylase RimI-like enzyme
MSSVTIPVKANDHPHIRPMNVLRDLSAVADLIELCFSSTMDQDGQRYLSDMRRASRDDRFLNWASHVAETASMPMTGYIWEQDGRVVGNASLIPFRDHGKRVYLIANVATHPEYRRHGIGRALTERAVLQARAKNASAVWLHVREDNPGAIRIYESLGFQEIARRTAWYAGPERILVGSDAGITVVPRHPRFWQLQLNWLRRIYPDHLSWYHSWNLSAMRPGFWNTLYLFFIDFQIKQWAAVRGEDLLATLTWMPQGGRSEPLYAATPSLAASGGTNNATLYGEALTRLLIHARHAMSHYAALSLDFPAGELTDAILAAGFIPRRTLLWMRA